MNSPSSTISETNKVSLTLIPGLANNLTIEQSGLLDALWDCLCETGASFPRRNLPQILAKRPLNDVSEGMPPGLFFEQFEAGERRYSLSLWGALSSSKGAVLVALFLRLLDLVKTLYEEDNAAGQIDSGLICQRLCLDESESTQLAAFVRIASLPAMPFHFSGQSADRSIWFLAITDDVVDLFHASSSKDYFEHKLVTATRPVEPNEALASVFAVQPMELWCKGEGASGWGPDRSDGGFVAATRLDALQRIEHAEFDCTRLVCLCDELNACAAGRCAHAVILLTRAILDHIPPVFGFNTFSEVSSNYGGGGRSFKASAERLDKQARKVADRMLHQVIRNREVAPEMKEVAFSQELETVLTEVCRILKPLKPITVG